MRVKHGWVCCFDVDLDWYLRFVTRSYLNQQILALRREHLEKAETETTLLALCGRSDYWAFDYKVAVVALPLQHHGTDQLLELELELVVPTTSHLY